MKTFFAHNNPFFRILAGFVLFTALNLSVGCDKSEEDNTILQAMIFNIVAGAKKATVSIDGLEWKKCSQGQIYSPGSNTCKGNVSADVNDGLYGAVTLHFCSTQDNACNSWTYPFELIAPTGSSTSEIYSSCTGDTTGGFSDWRVPNSVELQSILFDKRSSMLAYFPDTVDGYYWTATATQTNFAQANIVSFRIFDYGETAVQNKNIRYYLRCVRGSASL